VLEFFQLEDRPADLEDWNAFVDETRREKTVNIAVLGKYFTSGGFVLSDVYISVIEAIKHAAASEEVGVKLTWLNSEEYEKDAEKIKELANYDGIIIPGGFGTRGVEGKIEAVRYLRENNIPFLGICYGMQCAAIEFARNVAGIEGAHTHEVNPDAENLVINLQEGQEQNVGGGKMGGTMRLGSYPCVLKDGSVAKESYGGSNQISERHRHRYEFNNKYREQLEAAGLSISGTSPDNHFVEIIELPDHPFFVGVQFHPEFQSRPMAAHPLFAGLIRAAKTSDK
jgi:CTP synthase